MTLFDLGHPCNTPLFFFVWQLFGHKGLLRHRIILETLRFRDLQCTWFPAAKQTSFTIIQDLGHSWRTLLFFRLQMFNKTSCYLENLVFSRL